jgi:uncharacterized protein (TIGR02145 family)
MKKLFLISALLIFACSSDSEGNDCIYEPTLSTEAVTDITEASATLNGVISIISENCEVALGEMQGFVYSTNPSPTNEDNVEVVYGTDISTTIDNLIPNTTYYVRVFITNSLGEFYGNEIDFMTAEASLVNCDGNPIQSIVYGTQEWTVENACNITYRDGTPIPEVTDPTQWSNLTTGAWCYYDNDPTKPRLYNWYAVAGIHDADPNTPNKEFAPEGWHVPSDAEWTALENYLVVNGYNYDGTTEVSTIDNKLAKSMASTTGWYSSTEPGAVGNDQSLNNSSGFNALPVGYIVNNGEFSDESNVAFFWSSNDVLTYFGWCRQLSSSYNNLNKSYNPQNGGWSVRFVRD